MARITDEMSWDTLREEILAYLCLDGTSHDLILEGFTTTVIRLGDEYLGEVTDPSTDGEDFATFPEPIKQGVLEAVRVMHETIGPNARPFGLTSAKTGDLSEVYAVGSRILGGEITMNQILSVAKPFWFPYRESICA